MRYQKTFKRYELKYLITKEQQRELVQIMSEYMAADNFGKSTISNLYLDTPDRLLIRRSLDKPCYKEKLRVRGYGQVNGDSMVFVELKKKYDGVVYKRRIATKEATAINYLCHHIRLPQESQISKEIDYVMNIYGNLEPSMLLSYERSAFFSKDDEDFRLTFDENIKMRNYDLSLTAGIHGQNMIPQDMVLLEVKTVLGVEKWLMDFLSANKLYKISFSKYGNAYKELVLPQLLGGKSHVA